MSFRDIYSRFVMNKCVDWSELLDYIQSDKINTSTDFSICLKMIISLYDNLTKQNNSKYYNISRIIASSCKRYIIKTGKIKHYESISTNSCHQILCAFLHPSDVWLDNGNLEEFVVLSQARFLQDPLDCVQYLEKIDTTDEEILAACEIVWDEINKYRQNKTKSANN